jgi:hypothetical protein
MTQEDKKLLLKDLTARLSYGVKGIITYDKSNTTFTVEGIDNNVLHLSDAEDCYVEDFKPYLRPMSSMTVEERNEYFNIIKNSINFYNCPKSEDVCFLIIPIDWLNAHHFDYRGLIEKGLALEALEGMYN